MKGDAYVPWDVGWAPWCEGWRSRPREQGPELPALSACQSSAPGCRKLRSRSYPCKISCQWVRRKCRTGTQLMSLTTLGKTLALPPRGHGFEPYMSLYDLASEDLKKGPCVTANGDLVSREILRSRTLRAGKIVRGRSVGLTFVPVPEISKLKHNGTG